MVLTIAVSHAPQGARHAQKETGEQGREEFEDNVF